MNTTGAAVSFPEWKVCLRAVTIGDEQRAFFGAIVAFLNHCKERRCGATVGVAKAYVEARSAQEDEITRLTLRWFFRAAKTTGRTRLAVSENVGGHPSRSATGATGKTELGAMPDPAPRLPIHAEGAVPPLAAKDPGGADWERDSIKAAREAGLLWRTEETYRGWDRTRSDRDESAPSVAYG